MAVDCAKSPRHQLTALGTRNLIGMVIAARAQGNVAIGLEGASDSNGSKSNELGAEKVRRGSHPLRHLPPRKRSPDRGAVGFFRYFRGFCGWG